MNFYNKKKIIVNALKERLIFSGFKITVNLPAVSGRGIMMDYRIYFSSQAARNKFPITTP